MVLTSPDELKIKQEDFGWIQHFTLCLWQEWCML